MKMSENGLKKLLLLTVFLAVPSLCYAASTEVALKTIFRNEGGYQCLRDDSGNWTGGAIGKGRLVGTKFGICAATYPKENIKALTIERAAFLYDRDFAAPIRLKDIKSQWLATAFLDTAVNCGPGTAAILVARTINVLNGKGEDFAVDPSLGKAEVDWINSFTATRWYEGGKDKSRRALFGSVFKEMRSRRYVAIVRHNPKMLKWLPVWLERTYE